MFNKLKFRPTTGGEKMIKSFSLKKHKQQNEQIGSEINSLLRKIAYDGRYLLKIRFRKLSEQTNNYAIEIISNSFRISTVMSLETNPFNLFWFLISKKQIKRIIGFKHCKKSKYGGYTFY